jgi:branched-chain amino acid aminotransferase
MRKIITNKGLFVQADSLIVDFSSDQTVYEVLRIIQGVPIFLEDHFIRLQNSLKSQGIEIDMSLNEFNLKFAELIFANSASEGNVKFVFQATKNEKRWALFFIPHLYPTEKDYQEGVSIDLLFDERENPNSKFIQNKIRVRADQMISEQNLYEVLLVNRDGQITEGSRSNVFFVKDEVFYTAPASKVLVGITRQKVLECLNYLGYETVEKCVEANEISRYDAVFLSGTSPKVLPVKSIGNQKFNTQLFFMNRLMKCYDNRIDNYIESMQDSGINS